MLSERPQLFHVKAPETLMSNSSLEQLGHMFGQNAAAPRLDVPEHVPLTVPDRNACQAGNSLLTSITDRYVRQMAAVASISEPVDQAQCLQSSAAHFLFYVSLAVFDGWKLWGNMTT